MAQEHFDRLTAIDASFLHQEGPNSHMHVGARRPLRGPAAAVRRVPRLAADAPAPRAALPPEARRSRPPGTGRPLWVDDPTFNIEYHVRHTALPSPGLRGPAPGLTGRIFSQQLDRARPLWEVWMVEGLEDGGFALISKSPPRDDRRDRGRRHRAGAVRPRARARRTSRTPTEAWQPAREPSSAEVLAAGTARASCGPGVRSATARGGHAARPAGAALAGAREAAEGLGEIVWAGLNPAPETPLNVEIGPHRRYEVVRTDLDDFKLVKNAFGGTVNDVVLAVVSGALRDWLQLPRRPHRGARAARARAGLDPRRPATAARSATASPRCAARSRSTSRTRSSGCARSARRWTG